MNAKVRFFLMVRLVGLMALGLGLLAGASSASASAGYGWLRLAHLSPNTPAVDVYLYSFHDPTAMVVVHHVAYGTVSGYETIKGGEYTVAMRAAGAKASSPPVLSTTVDIHPGNAYTVAGLGPANGLRLQVLHDRLTTPRGRVLVRIIQASLTQPRVTVRAGKAVIARGLAFGSVTSYKVVSPGAWTVSAVGATSHASDQISLIAGTIHTIVVLDDPGQIALDDLLDAAGSKVAPAGAPATGFGGTAPRPVPSDLPWVELMAGGLLISGAGVWLSRRPRGNHAGPRRRPRAVM
jgi:hypothetical protein